MGKQWKQCQTLFLGAPKSLQMVTAAMKLKDAYSWKESYGKVSQPREHIRKQRHNFVNKGPSSQGYGFSSGHVWMWELDYEESWAWKNWCFWTVVLEKTLESPLDCKESNQSILKETSSEYSWEGLMLKLNLQYFGHLMQRTDSLEETLMLGKIEGRRRRGWQRMRWLDGIHRLNGHEFEQSQGDREGWGSWKAAVHGVIKSQIQLSDWTTTGTSVLSVMFYNLYAKINLKQSQQTC